MIGVAIRWLGSATRVVAVAVMVPLELRISICPQTVIRRQFFDTERKMEVDRKKSQYSVLGYLFRSMLRCSPCRYHRRYHRCHQCSSMTCFGFQKWRIRMCNCGSRIRCQIDVVK